MTYVFKLSEQNSILKKKVGHPIANDDLKVGLVGFYTTYLTPNVTEKNNKLKYEDNGVIKELIIPVGQWSIYDLEKYINKQPDFTPNKIWLKGSETSNTEINCQFKLFLTGDDSIGKVLGFTSDQVLEPHQEYISPEIYKINPFNIINVHCNLADGMILKHSDYTHRESDIIASFQAKLIYKTHIIYEPAYPLFFPIQYTKIDNIEVSIRDENDNVIDFGNSLVTVILKVCNYFFIL
jgi:hypothetical protein